MKVSILKETKQGEFRAAMVPSQVKELVHRKHQVFVQKDLGKGIGISDDEYKKVGAIIVESTKDIIEQGELIIKVKELTETELLCLNENHIVFTFLHLAAFPKQYDLLKKSGCIAIAYETVLDKLGNTPLLSPMSEVAGRLSILLAQNYFIGANSGKGLLLSGVPGVHQGNITIIGAGVVGSNALQMGIGMGAKVTVLDTNLEKLKFLDSIYGNKITTLYSNVQNIINSIKTADLIIGSVYIHGAKAPKLVTKEMLSCIKAGSVMVDVAIDQGGCFETSVATSYAEPTYVVDKVIHSCIANLPGGAALTSSYALSNATFKYVTALADKGYQKSFKDDPYFMAGLNLYKGKVTHQGVAGSFNEEYINPTSIIN